MPNPVIVDPEVVNEPKELAVPEFNKKEIEAISVEATKNAIASGDIELPPGGTKLYKHSIACNMGTVGSGTAIIYSNSSTPLTLSDLRKFNPYYEKDLILVNFHTTGAIYNLIWAADGSGPGYTLYSLGYWWLDGNGDVVFSKINDNTITDTVTEL